MPELPPGAAALTAAALAIVLSAVGSALAAVVVRHLGIRQQVRLDGPESHLAKQGTPQMAGIGFMAAIVVVAALLGVLRTWNGIAVVALMCAYGLIGLVDDYLKFARRSPHGWEAKYRFPAQVIVGALFVGLTQMLQPDLGSHPFLTYLFGVFVVVGGANAVNFADGLDGLAAGVTALVAAGLAGVAAVWGHAPALVVLAATVAGGAAGFLWVNARPAQAFMGDVGSMALGGALGGLAVTLRLEIVYGVLGWVFVVEAMSVILQVASFQLTGRRIFRMAPFHHHLEKAGWPEERIVARAWLLTALVTILTLAWVLSSPGSPGVLR
jgi:phospho-N-acetylmuramoyl-pentapeptide-transferase